MGLGLLEGQMAMEVLLFAQVMVWLIDCSWFCLSLFQGLEDPLRHFEGRHCPTALPLEELRGSKEGLT